MGPSFDALQACVPLPISSHVHIMPNVLARSLCSWPYTSLHLLKEGRNHPIVRFAYLCHMIGEELVFFSFLYIKLFELGVEVALNHSCRSRSQPLALRSRRAPLACSRDDTDLMPKSRFCRSFRIEPALLCLNPTQFVRDFCVFCAGVKRAISAFGTKFRSISGEKNLVLIVLYCILLFIIIISWAGSTRIFRKIKGECAGSTPNSLKKRIRVEPSHAGRRIKFTRMKSLSILRTLLRIQNLRIF